MAHTKSARKRIRQDEKRRLRNQSVKTRVRSLVKKFRASLEESDSDRTTQALKEAVQALDKAASKGIIHSKTASRRVARLSRAAGKKVGAQAPGTSA